MSEIAIFNYEQFQVRTVRTLDGETWFVASDVCAVLGLENVSRAVDRIDRADLSVTQVRSGGQARTMNIVNESGLYDLILDSRKPEAKAFRRWITSEVLPSIRRTGGYQVDRRSALSNRELALMVIAEADRAELAEQKVAELAPAAEQFHRWQTSPDTVYVVEWAKTIGLTQKDAFEALRQTGVLFKQAHPGGAFNVPKRGWEQYFVLVDEWLPGPKHWTKVPKITAEGQVVLAEYLLERGWIAP